MTSTARRRKARYISQLACGHWVLRGEQIICRDGQWICQPCALAAALAAPTESERPATRTGRTLQHER